MKAMSGQHRKKVVWYKAPTVTAQPTIIPPAYQEPEKAPLTAAAAAESTPVATPEIASLKPNLFR